MPSVFVSYVNEDFEAVSRIATVLREHEVTVWLDKDSWTNYNDASGTVQGRVGTAGRQLPRDGPFLQIIYICSKTFSVTFARA
jgi:hypothetical protein